MAKNPTSQKYRRDIDLEDLLYLIHQDLQGIAASSSQGGDDSDSESDSGSSVLAPMFVSGTIDTNGYFTPGEGAASWPEAQEQMFNGGILYLVNTDDGEPVAVFLAVMANAGAIGAPTDEGFIFWDKPSDEPAESEPAVPEGE